MIRRGNCEVINMNYFSCRLKYCIVEQNIKKFTSGVRITWMQPLGIIRKTLSHKHLIEDKTRQTCDNSESKHKTYFYTENFLFIRGHHIYIKYRQKFTH